MNRTESIDLLRGFIMVLMALDHASGLVGRIHFTEMWGVDFLEYPTIGWWFTRFVSHLCAPGFFFLMGMSIYLFAQKRLAAGWTASKIYTYFLKRGGLILLFMFFLEFPAWALGMSFNAVEPAEATPAMPGLYNGGFLIPTTVLYGLGTCMMIGGFLWKWKDIFYLLTTIACFALSGIYISNATVDVAYHPLQHFLLVPGMSKGAMVLYPIIPWLGVTTFGMFWASLLLKKQDKIYRLSLITGIAFIGAFLLLRYNQIGNFQKYLYDDWISFFTLIKYPPSVDFILITCGINLILFYLFSHITQKKWTKPLKIFGQTAMFFYIIHLYLYSLIGIPFALGCDITIMYGLWAMGLVVLYFICNRFLQFKKGTPLNSFWRMV